MCLKLKIHRTYCDTQRIVHLQRSPPLSNYDIYHPLEPPGPCRHKARFRPGPTTCDSHGSCCRVKTVFLCDILVKRRYMKCLGELEAHLTSPPTSYYWNFECVLVDRDWGSTRIDPEREQAVHESLREYMNHGAEVRKALDGLGLAYSNHPPGLAREALRAVNPELMKSWEMALLEWNKVSLNVLNPNGPVAKPTNRYTLSYIPNWYSAFKIRGRVSNRSPIASYNYSLDEDSGSSSEDSSSSSSDSDQGPFTPGGSTILPSIETCDPLSPSVDNPPGLLSPDRWDSREPAPEPSETPGGKPDYDAQSGMSLPEDDGAGKGTSIQSHSQIKAEPGIPEQRIKTEEKPKKSRDEKRAEMDRRPLNAFAQSLALNVHFNRLPEYPHLEPEVLESPRGTRHRRLSFVYGEQHSPEPRLQPGLRLPAIIDPSAGPVSENLQLAEPRVLSPLPPNPLGGPQRRPHPPAESGHLPSINEVFRVPLIERLTMAPIVNANAGPASENVRPLEPQPFAPVPPNPLRTSQTTLLGQGAPIFANQLPPNSELLDRGDDWHLNQPHPRPPFIWTPLDDTDDGSSTNANTPRSDASTIILPDGFDAGMIPPADQAPDNQPGYPLAPPRAAGTWSGGWSQEPEESTQTHAAGSLTRHPLPGIESSPGLGPPAPPRGIETSPVFSQASSLSGIETTPAFSTATQLPTIRYSTPEPIVPNSTGPLSFPRYSSAPPSISLEQREKSPLCDSDGDESMLDSDSEEDSNEGDNANASNKSNSSNSKNGDPPPPPGPSSNHAPGFSPPTSPPQPPPGSIDSASRLQGQDDSDRRGANDAQDAAVDGTPSSLPPLPSAGVDDSRPPPTQQQSSAVATQVSRPNNQNNQAPDAQPVSPPPRGEKRRSSSGSSSDSLSPIMECKLRRLENELRNLGSDIVPKRRRFY